jgi:hypothetical protein
MYNTEEEFAKFQEKVEKEEKKYENYTITAENFTFPHIYLTDEEIIEFNEECKKSKIDLKVVPLSEYMNVSTLDKDDRDINDDMKFLDSCFIPKAEYEEEKKEEEININKNKKMSLDNIIKDVNEFIGKKQKRIINDESDVSDASKDNSIFSFKSSIDLSKKKLNSEKEKDNEKGNKDNKDKKDNKNNKENKKNKDNKDNNKNKNKSQNKQKKVPNEENKKKKIIPKKEENNKNIIDKYFKKLIDTSEYEQTLETRKSELINEILEKSQNLTKEGLCELAKLKRISIIGDEFKINDLKQKTVNQLESLLDDIIFNCSINKLEPIRKDDIKTLRNKEEKERERERKSKERILKRKKMEEERKKSESSNKNNSQNNDNKEQDKKIDDDEFSSGSSYDDDSLN